MAARVSEDGRFVTWSASGRRGGSTLETTNGPTIGSPAPAPDATTEREAKADAKAAKAAAKAAKAAAKAAKAAEEAAKAAEEAAAEADAPTTMANRATDAAPVPSSAVFSGLTFALTVGGSEVNRRTLEDEISRGGGTLSNTVHRRVDIVVASEQALRRKTQAVRNARDKFGIALVSPAFVGDSLRAGKRKP